VKRGKSDSLWRRVAHRGWRRKTGLADRHVGSTAGVRVPRSAPRRNSRLERGDNLVSEFLVVVASLCGMASEVPHLAAPRNGIIPETASPPSHGGRRARARQWAGRDQRSGSTGRTLAAAGVYARSVSFIPVSWRLHRPLFFILNEQAQRFTSNVESTADLPPWSPVSEVTPLPQTGRTIKGCLWHASFRLRKFDRRANDDGDGHRSRDSLASVKYATSRRPIDDRMRGATFFGALRYAIRANSYQFVAIQWLVPSTISLVV
jgi:hypothetical protein